MTSSDYLSTFFVAPSHYLNSLFTHVYSCHLSLSHTNTHPLSFSPSLSLFSLSILCLSLFLSPYLLWLQHPHNRTNSLTRTNTHSLSLSLCLSNTGKPVISSCQHRVIRFPVEYKLTDKKYWCYLFKFRTTTSLTQKYRVNVRGTKYKQVWKEILANDLSYKIM